MKRSVPTAKLRLTGLEAAPDPGRAELMAVFDALPKEVRRFLEECPFQFNAVQAQRLIRERGTSYALAAMRASVTGERRRWAIERQTALEWAREAFRLGPRPKYVPPPGGWTVHNFAE